MEVLEKIQKILYKRIKEDKVMSQKELAENLGISPVAVNKWLNGGSIDISKIPAICDALSITPNYLFGFSENAEDIELLEILNSDQALKEYVLSRRK